LATVVAAAVAVAEAAAVRNGSQFSQWCGEAFHKLRAQSVEGLILAGALFLLDGGRRREGKIKEKKKEKKLP
jgi:hypothetical protein